MTALRPYFQNMCAAALAAMAETSPSLPFAISQFHPYPGLIPEFPTSIQGGFVQQNPAFVYRPLTRSRLRNGIFVRRYWGITKWKFWQTEIDLAGRLVDR